MSTANRIEGKRVLVTGGSGFIGSHIVDQLIDAGAGEITVIDNMIRGRRENLADAIPSGRVRLIKGDIRDREAMELLVIGSDIVFHQAALRITHCAAEPDVAMDVMVQATYNLLRSCARHDVEKVVMASSASIYGLAQNFPTPESDNPYDNRTFYGAAKSFGEGLLRCFHDSYGLDYIALRYFNVYGPRMDVHGKYTEVMVRWMERIEAGEAPIVFGDGGQTMDMIHVRDVARANILAAQSNATDRIYNVGSGTETSLLDVAGLIAAGMDRDGIVPEHAPERAVNPVPRRLCDPSAAERDLGFRYEIAPLDGIRELVAWWRAERARFSVPEAAE